ncbi:MAG: hypothetical protein HYT76_05150 [Deltaproteobacteria bacterium]|nr:hypothetical protein [Deltaproteobacteria bacterium]
MAEPIAQDPYNRHIVFRQEFAAAALAVSSLANIIPSYRIAASEYETGSLDGMFSQAPSWARNLYDPEKRTGRICRRLFYPSVGPSSDLPTTLHRAAMPWMAATSAGFLISQGIRLFGNIGEPSGDPLKFGIIIGDTLGVFFFAMRSIHYLLGTSQATRVSSLFSQTMLARGQIASAIGSGIIAVTGIFKLLQEHLKPDENTPPSRRLSTILYSTMDIVYGAPSVLSALYFVSSSKSFIGRGSIVQAEQAALGFARWNRSAFLAGRTLPILSGLLVMLISLVNFFFLSTNEKEEKSSCIGLAMGGVNILGAVSALPAIGFLSAFLMIPSFALGIWQTSIDYGQNPARDN